MTEACLGGVGDGADAGGHAAAEQADLVQGRVLVHLGHALPVQHGVLREGRGPHLHTAQGNAQRMPVPTQPTCRCSKLLIRWAPIYCSTWWPGPSIAEGFTSALHAKQWRPAHKVVDLLAALLVREARLVVAAHDAPAGPGAHAAAQVGLPARAHAAVPAERLCPGRRS